jgi:hypothetical protein
MRTKMENKLRRSWNTGVEKWVEIKSRNEKIYNSKIGGREEN